MTRKARLGDLEVEYRSVSITELVRMVREVLPQFLIKPKEYEFSDAEVLMLWALICEASAQEMIRTVEAQEKEEYIA